MNSKLLNRKKKRIALTTIFAILMGVAPLAKPNKLAHALRPSPKAAQVGKASWYSRHSPGINRKTANNEVFDDTALTCAMWNVPFNQKLKVTNIENGKSIIVRVNDRGPHKRLVRHGRVVDLTQKAFSMLAPKKKGLIKVKVEFL